MVEIKRDYDLKDLEKLGFKEDKRPNVLYSLRDELFGDVVVVWKDRTVSFYDFSDGIRWRMMAENILKIKEGEE